jgi:uncharacterized protein YegL
MATKTIKQKFIIDESGSMSPQQMQIINGFNEQLQDMEKEEREQDVRYLVSLTKFSHKVEKVLVDVPVSQVAPLTVNTYRPSGSTALFDAIGATIDCASQGETDVIVTIMTDGEENASQEWKQPAIKTLIDIRQKENKWGFVYFGANQDAWKAASNIGVQNAVNYAVHNTKGMMRSASAVRMAYTASALNNTYKTSNLTCNVNEDDLTS